MLKQFKQSKHVNKVLNMLKPVTKKKNVIFWDAPVVHQVTCDATLKWSPWHGAW